MKKTYQSPHTIIVFLTSTMHLLDASQGVTTGSTLGNEYSAGDVTYSRRGCSSLWDDDEE